MNFDPSRVAGLRSVNNVKVVVVMSEDSIATARAKSAAHAISDSERAGIEQRVSAQHESIRPDIEARGGTVVAKFHSALNGIKVDRTTWFQVVVSGLITWCSHRGLSGAIKDSVVAGIRSGRMH